MFDLRHLEHSTIIYEDPQHQPLLRLAWNKQDPNYLATMAMDALEVSCCNDFLSFTLRAFVSLCAVCCIENDAYTYVRECLLYCL